MNESIVTTTMPTIARWRRSSAKKAVYHYVNQMSELNNNGEWGAGCNQCPGRNLAQFELLKLMATLIRDYDIEQVDARKEWVFKDQFAAIPS
ncbi:hypothetical protein N7489_000593 [Penicillium chrysogenum]|uniref:Uncharacterized protein n=1 Tax=Penicillium chrysogenum TaxID=5076 RepID=A0ABQ8WGE8_PENCH|nr:uncharacterized protein N7489_000593 [Penicillium chrysogenum]XP_061068264.1 uncharacterized protein N7525_006782 [Penicillium rubens]KAJ5250183.1 hypothetical protein N7489_000593 [Penicillium chrysogenum]KAJ5269089.1 hypothetical protein N7505_004847 [Penicillium chrysogenum]KAJ5828529.1 hypothetical protein N7525_006782 [Penicillium rubens]